jgi:hypothetical protein
VAAAGVRRAVRGLWPDRNPLRRILDRVEAVVVAVLAVAFLAAAPVAALAAGHLAYRIAFRSYAQQAAWHRVPAVLLATVPASGFGHFEATVRARWVAPDGRRHTGVVLAPPDARAGGTVMVWVDVAGRLTGQPPLRLSQVRAQAVLAAVLAPVVLGFMVLCAGQLAHAVLGRRRLAAWDADWQATEPQWTRRR